MIFSLERLTDSRLLTGTEKSAQFINDLLDAIASKGNESASSCVQILRSLDQSSRSTTANSINFDEQLWNLFCTTGKSPQTTGGPVVIGDSGAAGGLLQSGAVRTQSIGDDLEGFWQSMGISWDS